MLSCLGLDNQFRLVFSKHILTPNTASLKIQRKLPITQQIERQTVIRCGAAGGNGGAVLPGGITFVVVPVVVRVLFMQAVHIVVTVGLGQNRCRSDGEVLAITLYHRGMKRLPSMSRCWGRIFSWATARCMARKEAFRMLISSISCGVTTPTAQAKASRSMTSRRA